MVQLFKNGWVIGIASIIFVLCGGFACTGVNLESHQFDLDHAPSSPQIVAPGLISTNLFERDFAISPDRKEIIFTQGTPNQSKRCLVRISKGPSRWTPPELLQISGVHQDIEPFYSPDGRYLFFASDRPLHSADSTKDYNLWRCEKVTEDWENLTALPPQINTEGNEFYPAVSSNYNLYYTATRRDGIGLEDIFVARFENQEYQEPQVLDTAINTNMYEFNAYVSPNEDVLIFSSYGRNDDLGGGDLYISRKSVQGLWQPSENLGSIINSDKLDYCPFLDITNSQLYWTSDRVDHPLDTISSPLQFQEHFNAEQNGFGNIYRISF